MTNEDIKTIEETIGYTFRDKDYLKQAFTRRSFASEHGTEIDNEQLEWLGDKMLYAALVQKIFTRYGKKTTSFGMWNSGTFSGYLIRGFREGELTDRLSYRTKKETLAAAIRQLDLQQYLAMGKGDVQQNEQDTHSVQEDLFEAVIGAVALDSDFDFAAIGATVEKMLHTDELLDAGVPGENYVAELQERYQKEAGALPDYQYQSKDGKWECVLIYKSEPFYGCGKTKTEARMNCARDAVTWFCADEERAKQKEQEKDAWSVVERMSDMLRAQAKSSYIKEAVGMLQEMWQKHEIGRPEYEFTELPPTEGTDGNPRWRCVCTLEGEKLHADGIGKTKMEAKKNAAYAMVTLVEDEEMHNNIPKFNG